ncbi:MAG TPA: alpha-amylase family glycosyl hydrolase, partial [Salinivirgaceae bacterium]|nr:alpha-amylase family glycosyl hydrolase [Salinivirgaceae bacterium]
NPELRKAMIDAMKFWLTETNIDGFRCDVAFLVPTDFWNQARKELQKVKPVFMLAEAEHIDLLEYAFNAEYGWKLHHIMNNIAQEKLTATALDGYFLDTLATYPKQAIKMNFTSNHDENSWNGTEFERLGDGAKTFAAFTFTIPGMPLIYNGQEVGFNHRLEFFEKDQINWNDNGEFEKFYKTLTVLRKRNSALWVADKGADMERILTPESPTAYVFVRRNDKDKVLAIFNFGKNLAEINLNHELIAGKYNDIFSNTEIEFSANETLKLNPWEFRILEAVK